jgi:AmmeMemoRadiSam system protein B
MDKKLLFDSKTEPIPEVRRDLQIIPVKEDGNSYLYFYDEKGYATQDLALNQQVSTLLSLLDGRKSINDLEPYLGESVNKDQVLAFIQVLDENRLLSSKYFQKHADEIESQYEKSTVHRSVTAGESYPADPKELTEYLDEAFAKHSDGRTASAKTKALYAPHIDPRVALNSFVKAFAPIRNLTPKRVVILATSHYAGLYHDRYENAPFILVNKDFELPLGTFERDQKAIEEFLKSDTQTGVTTHDRAHRLEHSIELHLLFLSYLWDHKFKVVPFLTRDLDDIFYMEDGHLGKQISNFSDRLGNHFGNDDETFFLISGDLAHFGKKFGDQSAASTMFKDVEVFDRQFLKLASKNQRREMLELMKEDFDPYRICGFPPLYIFLQSMPELKGKVLGYDLWDERERESAVTFGSILYSEQ